MCQSGVALIPLAVTPLKPGYTKVSDAAGTKWVLRRSREAFLGLQQKGNDEWGLLLSVSFKV